MTEEERLKERQRYKRWIIKNKDRTKIHAKKYRESEWGRKNRSNYAKTEKSKARTKAYLQTERGRIVHKLCWNKRRARKISADDGTITPLVWKDKLRQSNYTCTYCGEKLVSPHMDHVIPLSKGGLHTISNVVPACQSCNSSKHTKTPDEWKKIHHPLDKSHIKRVKYAYGTKENL